MTEDMINEIIEILNENKDDLYFIQFVYDCAIMNQVVHPTSWEGEE